MYNCNRSRPEWYIYNEFGFNKYGIHKTTEGRYDPDGFNIHGFNRKGIHKITNSIYDEDGYDKDGYDKDGFDNKGFNREKINKDTLTVYDKDGFDINEFNKEGYNREGYDSYNIDKNGINRETGKIDPRLVFAEKFLSYGKSIKAFAKSINMSEETVREQLEEIRGCSLVGNRIDELLTKNSSNYIAFILSNKEKILSGKISLEEVRCLQDIFMHCNKDEKIKLLNIVIPKIASHKIGVLNYAEMFNLEVDSGLPEKIVAEIKKLIVHVNNSGKDLSKNSKSLHEECKRIDAYKRQFNKNDISQMGTSDRMITINDEHINLAKEYLKAQKEFICYKTVINTLGKIIRDEITPENVERIKKERDLKDLLKQDGELGEVIDKSKSTIEKTTKKNKENKR